MSLQENTLEGNEPEKNKKTSKHENEKTAPKKKHVGLSSAWSSWLLATLSDVLEPGNHGSPATIGICMAGLIQI